MSPQPPTESHLQQGLRPYQWDGVQFLASRDAALLADEMGLGKTVQTAVALAQNASRYRRVLLVAPASLCLNWQRELERWAPEIVVRRVIGDSQDRAATYRLPIQLLIASYEQIRTDVYAFSSDVFFDLVILDEAQRVKNASSSASLACRLIPRERAWALSGTPLENHPVDVISIFRFLKPGLLQKGMSRSEIHQHIADHFLRRTKKLVLADLPPIIVQDLPLELGEAQRKSYEKVWATRRDAVITDEGRLASANRLAIITTLKQVCNFDPVTGQSAKLDALEVILDSVHQENEKLLIFSQYVKTLDEISMRIKMRHEIFHGGLSQEVRDRVIADFRQASGPRALLISIKAGGVGLNLQEATTVVLFDRWWNPAIESQAIQRAHRFGKLGPLHVFRFLVMDTIEERIGEILEEKIALFDEYVEGVPASAQSPTGDELKRILQI